MKNFLAHLILFVLKRRYRITISGECGAGKLQNTLILPNHPAEIDPVIISCVLWSKAQPRPVVLETIFKMPMLRGIFKMIGAIPMPDMEAGSGFYKRKRISKTLEDVVLAVNGGKNILIYPSGRLSLNGKELLAGASGTHSILQKVQSGKVLLVRSRGLWGSRFSKAQTGGKRPDIGVALLSSIATLIKNLFFFCPKRQVSLHFEGFSIAELRGKNPAELNAFLESWYNFDGGEKANCVSDFFLSKAPEHCVSPEGMREEEVNLDEPARTLILSHLSKLSGKAASEISSDLKLGEDLGLDSLSVAELITWLADEFHCNNVELTDLQTVNSIYKAVKFGHSPTQVNEATQTPESWLKNYGRQVGLKNSKSIAECFIRCAKANGGLPACADPILGVKSYSGMLVAALALRAQIKDLPGQFVGLVFPASVSCALLNFAILLSGKTPVLLNWTAGSRAVNHAVELLAIKTIISAGPVLDAVTQDLGSIEDKLLLLEELKANLKLRDKIKAKLSSFLPAGTLLKLLGLDKSSPQDTAAVLFTSGSEANPKAVPLSNQNILANIKSIISAFDFNASDVVYGFLPPFHSFGLTVTTLMPLLCGVRVAFSSNPNDSKRISQGCASWQISSMAGTPAFLRGILSMSNPEHLKYLRLVMSGADRLGDDVRKLFQDKAPKAQLLEGYGITECSPVVCAQRPNQQSDGVGPPLPDVRIKIVNPSSYEEVVDGEQGMVLISGPNVFSGYLGGASNPFHTDSQGQWYISGDLGILKNGSLVLSGRLKRFIKIGGEMISLPALEEALTGELAKHQQSPLVAIVDRIISENEKPQLAIFCNCQKLDRDEAHKILKSHGFPSIIKFSNVFYLAEMPLLGSGKIDIQRLESQFR